MPVHAFEANAGATAAVNVEGVGAGANAEGAAVGAKAGAACTGAKAGAPEAIANDGLVRYRRSRIRTLSPAWLRTQRRQRQLRLVC